MRKFLLSLFLPITVFGQTIVSTQPENRKAILEEFTGIHCQYCPQGHAIAEQILENNPGNAFAINIHQGGYATPGSGQPDFRTPFGNGIANQTGLTGYPAGTVNRHVFPGHEMGNSGTTAMDRGQWTFGANQIIAMPSYLNMGVEASINLDTREITVHVESYYTGNSPVSTNFLNVALLQNNTLGPQTGGNQGNNYNHMRRLVHLITGQWGEEINTTTQGSFIDKTFTYAIPESYNNVPVVLSEMEVVVFMTETTQEIISGNGAFPSLIGLEYQNDASITSIQQISSPCDNIVEPTIEIKNNGESTLTSLDIIYSVNGGESHTFNWTGSLTSLHTKTIVLPSIEFDLQEQNNMEISIQNDDENNSNNTLTTNFDRAVDVVSNNVTLELTTDGSGVQTRWIIRDSSGQMITQGNGYGNNQTYTIDIELPGTDCYSFRILDTGDNGGASFELKDENGIIALQSDGNYGSGFTAFFSRGLLGIDDQNSITNLEVYPNPSTGIVNLKTPSGFDFAYVYDTVGKLIKTFKGKKSLAVLDLSEFNKGVYVLRIIKDSAVSTKKIIIK